MCEFCENIPKTDEEFGKMRMNGAEDIIFYDNERGFCLYGDTGDSGCPYCLNNIKFCPMCGRKLSEETEKQNLRDRMIGKIKQTEPDYINYPGFYKKYGRVIPGIGDIWHWFENLTDEAKRDGLLQITDMSDTELFDLYVRINEDWEKTHSNQFWKVLGKGD